MEKKKCDNCKKESGELRGRVSNDNVILLCKNCTIKFDLAIYLTKMKNKR